MTSLLRAALAACLAACAATPALAGSPDEHAPIGVMGDHMHEKGEWMLSYRFMRMDMDGNRDGGDELAPLTIATTVPNRFFGIAGQPPTLRVVPTSMTMDMHMLGAMYAPSDRITLMVMGTYIVKEMDHLTYLGGAGTTLKGRFTTKSSGFGDTQVTALVRLADTGPHHMHANLGVSLPTGSVTEEDEVLPPPPAAGPTRLRLPYAMQLGSGTFDLKPGVTYSGRAGTFGWGAQVGGTIRLGENDEGYTLGNAATATVWGSVRPTSWISLSGRLSAVTQGDIDGIDPRIVAPVQTADPDKYGGDEAWVHIGANLIVPSGALAGNRLAIEYGLPVYRDLNGPQLETDGILTVGWQKAF